VTQGRFFLLVCNAPFLSDCIYLHTHKVLWDTPPNAITRKIRYGPGACSDWFQPGSPSPWTCGNSRRISELERRETYSGTLFSRATLRFHRIYKYIASSYLGLGAHKPPRANLAFFVRSQCPYRTAGLITFFRSPFSALCFPENTTDSMQLLFEF